MDGYAAHLSTLMSADSSLHPLGNMRISARKAGFSFPVHQATSVSCSRKNRVRKTASLPTRQQQLSVCGPAIAVTDEGSTVAERDIDVWDVVHRRRCWLKLSQGFQRWFWQPSVWFCVVLVWDKVTVSVPNSACVYKCVCDVNSWSHIVTCSSVIRHSWCQSFTT